MNIHEHQAKAVLKAIRRAGPRGHAGLHARRGGAAAAKARRAGLRGQVPDPRRRPRQGPFEGSAPTPRAACASSRRVEDVDASRGDARPRARHPPDRAQGPAGQPPLHRGGRRHRQRALPLPAGRPRDQPRGRGRLHRGRHGHRGGGALHPEKIITIQIDPATGVSPTTAAASPRRWTWRATSPSRPPRCWPRSTPPSWPRT